MDIKEMFIEIKKSPYYKRMGMIASHLGVVRETSLDGAGVSAIEISFDKEKIREVRRKILDIEGIFEVLIQTYEGRLCVGDEIMAVVIGGDRRENVFPALISAVDLLKKEASKKREIFSSGG